MFGRATIRLGIGPHSSHDYIEIPLSEVKVVCSKGRVSLKQCPKGRSPRPKRPTAGVGSWTGGSDSPSITSKGSGNAVSFQQGPGRSPGRSCFSLFWGFKNHHFLSTTHYSPAILIADFNDFAFTLGIF